MCADASNAGGSSGAHVPHFASVGFGGSGSGGGAGAGGGGSAGANRLAEAHANLDLKALNLQACVGGSYDPATNKICFTVPVYGQFCVDSPIQIPAGGSIEVCVQTCGSIIPTGLKATGYLNGSQVFTVTLFGFC